MNALASRLAARRGITNRLTHKQGTKGVAAVVIAGITMWLWGGAAYATGLQPALLTLGLDQQRAIVVVNLAGAAIAAALAALAANPPFILAWASGALWYGLLFAVRAPIQYRPLVLPGEAVAPVPFAMAALGLVGAGWATAGIGAAAGYGLRAAVAGVTDAVRRPSRRQLPAAALVLALGGASVFGLAQVPGILTYGPWSGVVTASHAVSGAQQVTFRYWSQSFDEYRQAVVLLPPEYTTSPNAAFPVLYLLHGSPGSDLDWLRNGAADIIAEAKVAQKAPAMIVVFPDGVGPRGGAGDYWADGYVPGDKMESDLIDDLIPSIETHFRVVPDQAHRAIGGLSSGGYGAANLALRHPGEFALALVFSGDLTPATNAFGGDQSALNANSPLRIALAPRPSAAAAFFVGWGRSDSLAGENQLFAQRLRHAGYVVNTEVVPGAHTWDVWRQLLWVGLQQMGEWIGRPVST
jgi:enterochelin esterase-like enzyme